MVTMKNKAIKPLGELDDYEDLLDTIEKENAAQKKQDGRQRKNTREVTRIKTDIQQEDGGRITIVRVADPIIDLDLD